MEIIIKVERCGIKTKKDRVLEGNSKSSMKKNECERVQVMEEGIWLKTDELEERDYNHYRMVSRSLKGTNDRAVMIVTMDIYEILGMMGVKLEKGDLGENLTISNLRFNSLRKGIKLYIDGVIIEITEPCIPCARLGNQEWAERMGGKKWWRKENNTKISNFINDEGARGWYGKVIKEGEIRKNMEVKYYIYK